MTALPGYSKFLEFTNSVDELREAIQGVDIEYAQYLQEPGSREILNQATIDVAEKYSEEFEKLGVSIDKEKCREIAYVQLCRAYMSGYLFEGIGNDTIAAENIDFDTVKWWYYVDLWLFTKAIQSGKGNEKYQSISYPGLQSALLSENPVFNAALQVCSEEALSLSDIDPNDVTDELELILNCTNSLGLRVACAEAAARAEFRTLSGIVSNDNILLYEHMFKAAFEIDHEFSEIFGTQRLYKIAKNLNSTDNVSLSRAMEAVLLHMSLLFGIEPERASVDDLHKAKVFLAAGKFENAFIFYEKASASGNLEAKYAMGILCELGVGCTQDEKRYKQLMKEAGSAGYPAALGECYGDGIGVAKDASKCLSLLEESANAGDTFAMGSLANICLAGSEAISPNPELAIRWFSKSSEEGNYLATLFLKEIG